MALLLRSFSLQTKQSLALWRQMTLSAASAPSQAFILRSYSNESSKIAKSEGRKDVGEAKPIGERVKETAKTTSYLGVILLGVGVTGIMFYTIFSELFSSNSPQSIYSKAFDKCKDDPRVQDSLGQPIKCFGEESRRRRRTHVAHQIYQKNERNYMRLSFHIQGIRGKATVHCEMRENDSGKYEYRYLFVQLDSYPHTTIILEDNRLSDPIDSSPANDAFPSSILS